MRPGAVTFGTLVSGAVYTGNLSATQINAGSMSVGGFTGMPSVVTVYSATGAGVAEIGTITAGSGGPYYGVWSTNAWFGGSGPSSALISLSGSTGAITGCTATLASGGLTVGLDVQSRFSQTVGLSVDDGTTSAVVGSSFVGLFKDSNSFNYAQLGVNGTAGSLILNDSANGGIDLQPSFQLTAISGTGSLTVPTVARAFLKLIATISGTTTTFFVPMY
jgi:hypothetical protein